MLNARAKMLLQDAAKAFEEGYSPFFSEWLAERGVTADECIWLSKQIALILSGYVHSSEQTQKKILICAAAQGEIGAAIVDSIIDRQSAMRRLSE